MNQAKLRIGICGAGSRGIQSFGVLLSQRDDTVVAALCDPNHVRMLAGAKQLGEAQACYANLEEMLAKAKLDAVIVTSPDHLHAQHAVTALEAGVHILVDKPLATTAQGCRDIIAAAKSSGKVAMVGFNMRHVAVIRRLKQIVDEGVLGRVFLIENREFYSGGRTYMARWNRKYELSGGLWVHKGSHDFDVFNWLLGFPKPVRVSAVAGVNIFNADNLPFETRPDTPAGPTCSACAYFDICPDGFRREGVEWGPEARAVDGYAKDLCMYLSDKDTHDNGIAIVEYANGARASHLECFVSGLSDRLYTLVGDKAQAEVSLHDRTILVRPRWKGDVVTYRIPEEEGGHGGSDPRLENTFVRAVKGEIEVPSTLEHGLWSTVVGQAAELAWRESRVVEIDELLA